MVFVGRGAFNAKPCKTHMKYIYRLVVTREPILVSPFFRCLGSRFFQCFDAMDPAPRHRFEHLLTLTSRSSRDSVHAVARSLADEVMDVIMGLDITCGLGSRS